MDDLFLRILDMSITASWVILAVMAVRLLLRKAPKKYSYALWAAVLFRLVCPVSIQSVVSAFNFSPFRQAASQATGELQFIPRDIEFAATPQINTGIPVVDNVVNNQLPAVIPQVSVTPEVSITPMQMLIFIGMTAWIIGMAAMVAISIVNYIRLRKGLRFAVRMEDNIWLCETVRSPFLVGLVKPKIYLPYGLDEQTQEYILAHEKYHLKRLDHIAKLLGYAALTVHWFNPLCHVAFRMMNRDMEMSCDEHVLDRNNIPTTRYSLSLLTIATNRRFPAATPLAFAETGVRERMINVLNWKKPKKWVSVVAVLVCAILLISCATNPKVNDTTTDVSMLEFPGIKWGATPEEVKDALNLKNDQIVSEQTRAYDASSETKLAVTNIEFFGGEVESAVFSFCTYTDQAPVLYDIAIKYTEETDMALIRDNLMEVYGPGTNYGFTDYEIFDGKAQSFINYNRTYSTQYGKTIEANAWVELPVDDICHRWASTVSGSELITPGAKEALVYVRGNHSPETRGYAERETVLEYIEKHVWVTLICTEEKWSENTVCFSAEHIVANQSLGTYFERLSNATEPTEEVTPTKSPDGPYLFFPDVSWGMEPYQIKEIFGLTEEQILTEGPVGEEYILQVKDISFFDSEVASARFKFLPIPSGQHLLCDVTLYYPEETDMTVIKNALTEYYTEPKTGNGFTRYRITDDGTVESYSDYGVVDPDSLGSSSATAWWESEVKLKNRFAKEEQEKMIKREILLNGGDESRRDSVLEYLEKEPSAFICCTDSGNTEGLNPAWCTKNIVSFSAYTYMSTLISYLQ